MFDLQILTVGEQKPASVPAANSNDLKEVQGFDLLLQSHEVLGGAWMKIQLKDCQILFPR